MAAAKARALRIAGAAAAALPAAGFAVLAYIWLTLPDVRSLKTQNPSTTAFIELRASEARAKGLTPRRVQRWVSYGHISADLKRAVLVAEDDAFWQHDGVDYEQLQESLETDWARGRLADWLKGKFARGGSTITQQLAKNLYLSPSKTPLRKLRELLIARRLEAELKKARILELYLNVIEWGDGIYGVEAAARAYFSETASELGPGESALLAAAIVNPRRLNPAKPTPRLVRRQQLILHRMGAVSPPESTAEAVPPAEPPAEDVARPEPADDALLPKPADQAQPPLADDPLRPKPAADDPSRPKPATDDTRRPKPEPVPPPRSEAQGVSRPHASAAQVER